MLKSSTIHNTQQVRTTQMFINRWMDKQNVVYPYKEIFFSHKKEYGFPGGAVAKNPPANAGDTGSSPGPRRSHMPRSN